MVAAVAAVWVKRDPATSATVWSLWDGDPRNLVCLKGYSCCVPARTSWFRLTLMW